MMIDIHIHVFVRSVHALQSSNKSSKTGRYKFLCGDFECHISKLKCQCVFSTVKRLKVESQNSILKKIKCEIKLQQTNAANGFEK